MIYSIPGSPCSRISKDYFILISLIAPQDVRDSSRTHIEGGGQLRNGPLHCVVITVAAEIQADDSSLDVEVQRLSILLRVFQAPALLHKVNQKF